MSNLVKVVQAESVEEGRGAIARRLFPNSDFGHLDPFVLFDEYFIDPSASFPMHGHGGFEGIQYLAEGSTLYRDSKGNEGWIDAGGARRFLAGEGFEHMEMPRPGTLARGFLLWINLPADHKRMSTSYQQLSPDQIPRAFKDGVMVTTVLGDDSPLQAVTPAVMRHLTMTEGSSIGISANHGHNSFLFLADGSADVSGLEFSEGSGVILADNSEYVLKALSGSEVVFVSGRRIGQRIVHDDGFVR
jgi:hypothetical protein